VTLPRYDIIGDVHGHARLLEKLLENLEYRKIGGVWAHQKRQAVFVGDLIDRGDEQMATLEIVRPMVDEKTALCVMGNHEYNAIGYATEDPGRAGEHLRGRTGASGERHTRQHRRFLEEIGVDSEVHLETVEWFKKLPLWLDLGGIRVIHACWWKEGIETLTAMCQENHPGVLREEHLLASYQPRSPAFLAIEHCLKGPERKLPEGETYRDKDGNLRGHKRTEWWGEPEYEDLGGPITFIGHYWRSGEVATLHEKVVCVDYSAGKGGPLAAYRWQGEERGEVANFILASP